MRKATLDRAREYVLSDPADHPLSPQIVMADLLGFTGKEVSLSMWYLQREGLVGKYKPDGYKFEIWTRTPKALTMIENRAKKKAEN